MLGKFILTIIGSFYINAGLGICCRRNRLPAVARINELRIENVYERLASDATLNEQGYSHDLFLIGLSEEHEISAMSDNFREIMGQYPNNTIIVLTDPNQCILDTYLYFIKRPQGIFSLKSLDMIVYGHYFMRDINGEMVDVWLRSYNMELDHILNQVDANYQGIEVFIGY